MRVLQFAARLQALLFTLPEPGGGQKFLPAFRAAFQRITIAGQQIALQGKHLAQRLVAHLLDAIQFQLLGQQQNLSFLLRAAGRGELRIVRLAAVGFQQLPCIVQLLPRRFDQRWQLWAPLGTRFSLGFPGLQPLAGLVQLFLVG